MCTLVSSLKRSSPSLVRNCKIHRLNSDICFFSHLPRSSSSSLFEEPTQCEDSTKWLSFPRDLSGVVVVSGIGVWLSYSSSSTYTDSVEVVGAVQPNQQKKTRYLFADGKGFMTPADLMHTVVIVFPSTESDIVRDGYLRWERRPGDLNCTPSRFFMLFDMNNDGLISFPEYIFFVTLLSIPEKSFSIAFKLFDLDRNGEIAQEEFNKVMALMRSFNRQGALHKNGRRHGLKVQKSVENGSLIEYLFGKDGNGILQHEKFVQFLKELRDEILRLEFSHYDCQSRGTISAKDFEVSMVASADMNHINRFLDQVDELNDDPHLQEVRISFEEFKAFAELRQRLKSLALAIFCYDKVNGLLTKEDFQCAVSHVCGIGLTDNVIVVVFLVFDHNNDGSIHLEEFLHVLQKHQWDLAHPVGSGFAAVFSCWLNCSKSCSVPQMLYEKDLSPMTLRLCKYWESGTGIIDRNVVQFYGREFMLSVLTWISFRSTISESSFKNV